ncbi:XRE family transcriptional regulator [Eubacterium callanderi]|nr:XRE family transcriptional regulator [Eubacterium callanderi]
MRLTLKSARELNKLTQEKAAKLIGVSVDTLGNYERGKSYPDVPILRKIEEVYGIPYNRLIFLPLDYDKTVNMI